MTELYDEFFAMLRFTKNLYDCGMGDRLKNQSVFYQLDADEYWGLTYEAIGWVFADTRLYYNKTDEMETWLFTDPVIDRFCQLCQEYENRRGISEEENPFRRDLVHILYESFRFSGYGYGYDWRLSPKERGRKCLLLFTGCEFYNTDEVSGGLLDIKDGFESINARLEEELSKDTRIIPLSFIKAYREAA